MLIPNFPTKTSFENLRMRYLLIYFFPGLQQSYLNLPQNPPTQDSHSIKAECGRAAPCLAGVTVCSGLYRCPRHSAAAQCFYLQDFRKGVFGAMATSISKKGNEVYLYCW